VIVPLDMSEAVMKWAPVVTGDNSFPQQPLDAFQKGEIIKVPLIIGANLNDGMLFSWAISSTPMPTYEYIALIVGVFQDDWVPQILENYPYAPGDNRPMFSQLLTDYAFYCSARHTLRLAEASGISETYLYMFTQQAPFCPWPPSQNYCCNAVCHGDELAYVFHDSGYPYPWNMTTNDLFIADAMTSYWTSFAASGNPNQNLNNKFLAWPIYRAASDITLNIRVPLTPTNGYNAKSCDFWDSVGYYHAGKMREVINKISRKSKY